MKKIHQIPISRFKRELNSWCKCVTSGNDGIIITRQGKPVLVFDKYKRPKYTLDELLSQCDLSEPAPDLDFWHEMDAVGNEKIGD